MRTAFVHVRGRKQQDPGSSVKLHLCLRTAPAVFLHFRSSRYVTFPRKYFSSLSESKSARLEFQTRSKIANARMNKTIRQISFNQIFLQRRYNSTQQSNRQNNCLNKRGGSVSVFVITELSEERAGSQITRQKVKAPR